MFAADQGNKLDFSTWVELQKNKKQSGHSSNSGGLQSSQFSWDQPNRASEPAGGEKDPEKRKKRQKKKGGGLTAQLSHINKNRNSSANESYTAIFGKPAADAPRHVGFECAARERLRDYHLPRTFDSDGDVYMCDCDPPPPPPPPPSSSWTVDSRSGGAAEPPRCHSRLVVEHSRARRRARTLAHEKAALEYQLGALCRDKASPDALRERAQELHHAAAAWLEEQRREDDKKYGVGL